MPKKTKPFASPWQTTAAVLCAVALFFFLLTCAIGLPIYLRPFYYAHIEGMNLPEVSGFSAGEIRAAYDEVLDYLTLPGREFSAGAMAFSAEGAAHFADCKRLFDLNAGVLLGSGGILLVLWLLRRTGRLAPLRLRGHTPGCFAAVAAIVLPVILGVAVAVDFDRAFVVFHKIFFPGKDNWLFDPCTDQIIQVLPEEFFLHCAILIGAGIVIFAAGLLVFDGIVRKSRAK